VANGGEDDAVRLDASSAHIRSERVKDRSLTGRIGICKKLPSGAWPVASLVNERTLSYVGPSRSPWRSPGRAELLAGELG
jgi:hypothetical protein